MRRLQYYLLMITVRSKLLSVFGVLCLSVLRFFGSFDFLDLRDLCDFLGVCVCGVLW